MQSSIGNCNFNLKLQLQASLLDLTENTSFKFQYKSSTSNINFKYELYITPQTSYTKLYFKCHGKTLIANFNVKVKHQNLFLDLALNFNPNLNLISKI